MRYAVYVEYGTSKMQAQPYLRPAFESALRNFESILGEAMTFSQSESELKEVLARLLAQHAEGVAKERVPEDTGKLKASIKVERIEEE